MKFDEHGAFWGDEFELTTEEKNERKKKLAKKAPYTLCIRTDSYTGNFEREMVAFAVGILDSVQSGISYGTEYLKAFWNCAEGSPISSYEDYKASLCKKKETPKTGLSVDSIEKIEKEHPELVGTLSTLKSVLSAREKEEEDEYGAMYDEFLCYTYQVVDDWEQDTFYNIGSYPNTNGCDCIYIQLNKPLEGRFETLLISRIVGFFESAYDIIDKYTGIINGENFVRDKNVKLLSIELMDKEGKVLKNYSDWRPYYDSCYRS